VKDLTEEVTTKRSTLTPDELQQAGTGVSLRTVPKDEMAHLVKDLEKQMKEAASQLEFEKAALLRDQIFELRRAMENDKEPEWERIRRQEREEHLEEIREARSLRAGRGVGGSERA
jgi:excinuclease ABC subunit B